MNSAPNSRAKKTLRFVYYTTISILAFTILIFLFLLLFPKLPISHGPIAKFQAYTYSTRKILLYSISSKKESTIVKDNAKSTVKEIVHIRSKNKYLYTGGHYTDFYIRNLGTFANKLVNATAADSAEEWIERLSLIERSTDLALSVFQSYNQITTTIVQLENGKYVPINIYAQPSDSLPSLLRILHQLNNLDQQVTHFPISTEQQTRIHEIQRLSRQRTSQYSEFLKEKSDEYVTEFTDSTGLIKKDIVLSGIKDAWIRKSSLYDNVMLFAVYKYNDELNLHSGWGAKADQIKSLLLTERWDGTSGIFYDEAPESKFNYFSADNLITFEMGMLSASNPQDRPYLESIVAYIQKKQLDQPFPLKTTELRIPSKEHLPVRIFAPNYIGTTIWSYWGMLYIDLLTELNQNEKAAKDLTFYSQNIQKYNGFPELYAPDGTIYKTPFYHSVNDMIWGIYYLYLDNKLTFQNNRQ